jgi:hypothetical protein
MLSHPPPAPSTELAAVDAVAFLEEEHAWTRDLLGMVIASPLEGRKGERIVTVAIEDLWIHLQLEDELLYPTLFGPARPPWELLLARAALKDAVVALEVARLRGEGLRAAASRALVIHDIQNRHEEEQVFSALRRGASREARAVLGLALGERRSALRGASLRA